MRDMRKQTDEKSLYILTTMSAAKLTTPTNVGMCFCT